MLDVNKEDVWDWYKRDYWIYCDGENKGGIGSFYSGTSTWRVTFRDLPQSIKGNYVEEYFEYKLDLDVYLDVDTTKYYIYYREGEGEEKTEA